MTQRSSPEHHQLRLRLCQQENIGEGSVVSLPLAEHNEHLCSNSTSCQRLKGISGCSRNH